MVAGFRHPCRNEGVIFIRHYQKLSQCSRRCWINKWFLIMSIVSGPTCDISQFNFNTTEKLADMGVIIGQTFFYEFRHIQRFLYLLVT